MIVRKYGISLCRIGKKDIELIRKKRNSPAVRRHMLFRETITRKMQEEWFRKIDNENNVYFIILHGRKKIGLTNASNIDWKKKSSEGGIFLWDQDYVNTPIPVIASLVSFELFFTVFGLRSCYIKIRKDNLRAQEFNEMAGFKRITTDPALPYYNYRLSAADYRKRSRNLLAFIRKISGDQKALSIGDLDFSKHRSASDLKLYAHLPAALKREALAQRPKKR